MKAIVAIVALGLFACGAAPAPKPSPVAPKSDVAPATGFAPMLFTVDQLRAGNAKGRIIELRMEIEGKASTVERWEFTAVDETSATIHSITRDFDGQIVDDKTATSTWIELHKHGQLLASETTIEDNVSLTVPAGTFTTRLYTVKAAGGTRRIWFAVDLPGPPVQFTIEKDGKIVMRLQMLRAR